MCEATATTTAIISFSCLAQALLYLSGSMTHAPSSRQRFEASMLRCPLQARASPVHPRLPPPPRILRGGTRPELTTDVELVTVADSSVPSHRQHLHLSLSHVQEAPLKVWATFECSSLPTTLLFDRVWPARERGTPPLELWLSGSSLLPYAVSTPPLPFDRV